MTHDDVAPRGDPQDAAPADCFRDIRPYRDTEIRPVLDRLLVDAEFLGSLGRLFAPRLSRHLPGLMRHLVGARLRRRLRGVNDVRSMQEAIAPWLEKAIRDTTSGLSHSGLENLEAGRNYLFISNHRDIAMDPAFVNYLLYHAGHDTLRVATGDNLVKKPFVNDLMRLNKSFIVHRSLKGRELLLSLKRLSDYIHHSIAGGHNVWIAQREGRAKDGIDRTDPALLKMLAMGCRGSFAASLNRLHILPMAISYEFDACDVLKADELHQLETTGTFVKDGDIDMLSLATGVIGFKGQVHVAFGAGLKVASDDPDQVAAEIDARILDLYRLHDTNHLALEKLRQQEQGVKASTGPAIGAASRRRFERRLQAVAPHLRRHFLLGYANAVICKTSPAEDSGAHQHGPCAAVSRADGGPSGKQAS